MNGLKDLIEEILKEDGAELHGSMTELVSMVEVSTATLASLVDDTHFSLALRAERDAIQLKFAIAATSHAKAVEHRLIGVIHAALRMGAMAISKT